MSSVIIVFTSNLVQNPGNFTQARIILILLLLDCSKYLALSAIGGIGKRQSGMLGKLKRTSRDEVYLQRCRIEF